MLSNLFNRFSSDLNNVITNMEKSVEGEQTNIDNQIKNLKTENDNLIRQIQEYQMRERGLNSIGEYYDWRNQVEDDNIHMDLKNGLQQQLRNLINDNISHRSLYLQKKMTIDKYSQYLSNSNEHLKRQLKSLQDMQYDISTKNRITDMNNRAYEEKRKRVNQILVFFIFAGVAIIPLVAFLNGSLSRGYFGLIIFVLILLYLAYLLYISNVGEVKTIGQEVIRDFGILARDLDNGVYVVKQDIANTLFGQSYGVPCTGCPPNSNQPININDTSNNNLNNYDVVNNDNKFYYYDGSMPAYTIVPETKQKCEQQPPFDMQSINGNNYC